MDILESKLPTDAVINIDNNHPSPSAWTQSANKAIAQVVNYLEQLTTNIHW